MHGIGKGLGPHFKPEKQKPTSSSSDVRAPVCKPRIVHGRAGVRRKVKVALQSQPRQTPAPATEPMPEVVAQLQVAAEHASPVQTDFRQPIGLRIETRSHLS